jgi:hypothetical protein
MLGNHHANNQRAGAGRERCGSAQDALRRMAGQQERNDDEQDARRTTSGHPAVARVGWAMRLPPAATDATTQLASRWVLAPGPDGRERLERRWQVVDQRPHTLHGAEPERAGGEPSVLERAPACKGHCSTRRPGELGHTQHETAEDTMKSQSYPPAWLDDPMLMPISYHFQDLEYEVERHRFAALARAARPRSRSPLTVLVQWLRARRLARHRPPVDVDVGLHPYTETQPAPPPSSLPGRTGIGISDM